MLRHLNISELILGFWDLSFVPGGSKLDLIKGHPTLPILRFEAVILGQISVVMGPFWLKFGFPYSQNWFQYVSWDAPRVDPTTIQTVSRPFPNHIRPSYQQALGGSFVAKISPFWASSDHKWGCPIYNLSKDIDIQCWTRFLKNLAFFGKIFVIFGSSWWS